MNDWEIRQGHVLDLLAGMEAESVQTVCTSPPYYSLRSYNVPPSKWPAMEYAPMAGMQPISIPAMECCLGLEPSLDAFIGHIVEVFRGVWRVLRKDGTAWVNFGDSYVAGPAGHQDISSTTGKTAGMFAKGGRYRLDNYRRDTPRARGGLKSKDLMMVPARIAIALQADGWYLRSDIIWAKRAPMPESVTDRPTSAHEHIYLLAKAERYYYDADAVRETSLHGGRLRKASGNASKTAQSVSEVNNRATAVGFTLHDTLIKADRNMWNYLLISPEPCPEAHFATFPSEIPRRAILAGTSEHGACAECGSPYRRVVEREPSDWPERKAAGEPMRHGLAGAASVGAGGFAERGAQTTGWEPSCAHKDAPIVPCVVLDPFSGSGTTVKVALRLGRRGLGLEINPEYVAMSERIIRDDCPMFNMAEEATA